MEDVGHILAHDADQEGYVDFSASQALADVRSTFRWQSHGVHDALLGKSPNKPRPRVPHVASCPDRSSHDEAESQTRHGGRDFTVLVEAGGEADGVREVYARQTGTQIEGGVPGYRQPGPHPPPEGPEGEFVSHIRRKAKDQGSEDPVEVHLGSKHLGRRIKPSPPTERRPSGIDS